MRLPELSTPLPLLAQGEPACSDAKFLTPSARDAILTAATHGRLQRCGLGWFAADKRRPFHRKSIAALIERGVLYRQHNTARLTKRGHWFARTLCSEIAGAAFTTATEGEACHTAD